METTHSVSAENIRQLAKRHLLPRQTTRTDGLVALRVLGEAQQHEGRVTPAERVDEWLPWVHIAIGNLKAYLLGTFHGITARPSDWRLKKVKRHVAGRRKPDEKLPRRAVRWTNTQ
jgi:hypothetical protein